MNKDSILFVNLRRSAHEGMEAISAAKKLGLNIALLTDKVPSYIENQIDVIEQVDTYDVNKTVEAAYRLSSRLSIAGVVTWADRDVEVSALIAKELRLRGPSREAAYKARNKYAMKQALNTLPEIVPKHFLVNDKLSLCKAVDQIGFPAILKPSGASGSKGIFTIRNSYEAESAFNQLQAITKPDKDGIFRHYGSELIYEEFIEGPEFSVEGWVNDGLVSVVGITDKWTTKAYHLESQHIHQSILNSSIQAIIKEKVSLVVKTLGLDYCAFHLEAKWTKNGFRFIEIAARVGGDYITSHLVPLSHNLSFCEQTIRIAIGKPIEFEADQPINQYSGIVFLKSNSEGVFAGIKNLESLQNNKNVRHIFIETMIGSQVILPPKHFGLQRVGAVIATDSTYEGLVKNLNEIETNNEVIIN